MLRAINALGTGLVDVLVDTWPPDSEACEGFHAHNSYAIVVKQIKNGAANLCR